MYYSATGLKHANGTWQPYFSPAEIQAGMLVAVTAVKLAEDQQKQNTGTSQSASQ